MFWIAGGALRLVERSFMRNLLLGCFCLAALLGAVRALPAEAEWLNDFEAAKTKAAKDGKDLLLEFTGSDWCPWCIRLKKEVFSTDAFKKEAPKHFVLVELDFPKQTKLPDKLKQQNDKLFKDYQVEGFPTVCLTDARGRIYAKAGYQEGGGERYVGLLGELCAKKPARDALFAKAEKASGIEKAKLLDEALGALEKDDACVGYDDVAAQIIALDSANQAGLKLKYQARMLLGEASAAAEGGDLEAAQAKIEVLLKEPGLPGPSRQEANFLKAMVLVNKKDNSGALNALQAAREAAPQTERAKEIAQVIERLKAAMTTGTQEKK
jgi:thioredoxin-related protein